MGLFPRHSLKTGAYYGIVEQFFNGIRGFVRDFPRFFDQQQNPYSPVFGQMQGIGYWYGALGYRDSNSMACMRLDLACNEEVRMGSGRVWGVVDIKFGMNGGRNQNLPL